MPAAVLAALTGVLGLQVARLLELVRWGDHTDAVIASARAVERQLVDGETGVRGFLAYRDPAFLEPYTRAEGAVHAELDALERLVGHAPGQVARVVDVRRTLAAWQAYARDAVAAGRAGRLDPAPAAGMVLMDDLRGHVRGLISEEEGLRDARAGAVRRQTAGWIVTAVALALAATAALAFAAARAIRAMVRGYEATLGARDEFLGIAAHELKTPLTAVHLELDRLVRASVTGDPRLREMAERALRGTDRLAALVQQILEVPRLEGEVELAREPVNLAEVARNAIRRAQRAARAAGVTVGFVAEDVTGAWDRRRLGLAVDGLVSNAIKFGRGRPVHVRVARRGDRAVLEVHDHGDGMDPEALARVFERFERAVPVRHFGGLGLGLWVTRRIAEVHGGAIRVESAPDAGSRFTLELPIGPEPRAAVVDAAPRHARA